MKNVKNIVVIVLCFVFACIITGCDSIEDSTEVSQGSSAEVSKEPRPSLSELKVSRYEKSSLEGVDSWKLLSNVYESEENKALFEDDCIIALRYTFNLSESEARDVLAKGFAYPEDSFCSYRIYTETNSLWNKQGAYSLLMMPDLI